MGTADRPEPPAVRHTRRRRSSRSCTPRRRPGCATTSSRLGRGKGDALLLVDMVTSLGGIQVAVDDWAVDIAYSGTQKCLGVPPGLSPLTVSDRAMERLVERPSSWYLDLNLLARYVNDSSGGGRVYHHTAPVTMVAALHAGLGALLEEGLVRRLAAPRRVRRPAAARAGRPRPRAARRSRSTACPSSRRSGCPDGIDDAAVRRDAAATPTASRSAPEPGSWPGRVWRIGCMGHTARRRNVLALLGALGEVLGR